MNNELSVLLSKAQTFGLTFEEKIRFNQLKPNEPRCRCGSHGEQCKLHGHLYHYRGSNDVI